MLCHTTAMLAWQGIAPLARPESIGWVQSTERPARCHWNREQDADRCSEIIGGIEDAWDVQVDEMGFPPPVPDSDGILDIYIDAETTGYGAYAYGPSIDSDPGDGRMSCHAYIAIHPDYDEDFRWTMLHEFNHVLQYATDFAEPRYVPWEGAATAAEVWTDPSLAVVPSYVADFQATPWLGLMGDSWVLWDDYEIWSYYEYGSALWFQFLDAQYGDGAGSAGVEMWMDAVQESWVNEPDFLDASGQWTGDWQTPLMDFSMARAAVGTPDGPSWAANLTDASLAISVEASLVVDDLPDTVTPAIAPFQTGAVYVEVLDLTPGDVVTFTAVGEESVRWGLVVSDGKDGDWTEDVTLSWTVQSGEIVVGAVHLGGPDFDADDPLRQDDVAIRIALGDSVPVDTGDLDGAGGAAMAGGSKGCGCGATSGSMGWWLALLAPLIRRRRPTRSTGASVAV